MLLFDETPLAIPLMQTSMKYHWLRRACLALSVLGAYPQVSAAAPPAAASSAPSKTVTLNFVNADIAGVVKAMAEITGKNFVLDPRVKGTVNIISGPQPVLGATRCMTSSCPRCAAVPLEARCQMRRPSPSAPTPGPRPTWTCPCPCTKS